MQNNLCGNVPPTLIKITFFADLIAVFLLILEFPLESSRDSFFFIFNSPVFFIGRADFGLRKDNLLLLSQILESVKRGCS